VPFCDSEALLFDFYQKAVGAYRESTHAMIAMRDEGAFRSAATGVEEAKCACEAALAKLDSHRAEHGCKRGAGER
jgi:hypothetical protein